MSDGFLRKTNSRYVYICDIVCVFWAACFSFTWVYHRLGQSIVLVFLVFILNELNPRWLFDWLKHERIETLGKSCRKWNAAVIILPVGCQRTHNNNNNSTPVVFPLFILFEFFYFRAGFWWSAAVWHKIMEICTHNSSKINRENEHK
jgi:hypothetical protein